MCRENARRFFASVFCAILSLSPAIAQDAPSGLADARGLTVIAREATGKADFDPGRQYAVIIGIDKYKEWTSLRSAVSEAKALRKVLGERYYIDEFFELYDEAATASSIRRLFMDTLPAKIGIKDSLLVFYAGHGHTDATKTGFWIASDGSRDVYAQNNWIPNAQLRNMIGNLKAQRILILADACFSGDFLNVSRAAAPVIDSAYFRTALSLTARQVLTSGASESVPDESEFGRQILNLLERNDEPLLDPLSMYDRLRRGVTKTLPLLGSLPGNEEGASFVLFLRPSVAPAAAAAAVLPPPSLGELLVSANESAVSLWIDGSEKGLLGAGLFKGLEPGERRIELKGANLYGEARVSIAAGKTTAVKAVVRPVGSLVIEAPEDAVIRVEGPGWSMERKGGGAIANVPAGQLTVSAGGEGYFPARAELALSKGQAMGWIPWTGGRIEFELRTPDALCSLDGGPELEALGSLAGVAPGMHTILLKKAGWKESSQTVSVSLGKSARVTVALERLAPARLVFPDFGIGLGLEVVAEGARPEASKERPAGTVTWSAPAGLPLKFAFVSPYAERLDLPAIETTFAEGEERRIDPPSGSIVLPWLPAGTRVSLGSAKKIEIANAGGPSFRSPALPPGEYSLSLPPPFAYSGRVAVQPDSEAEPTGFREAMAASIAVRKADYAKQQSSKLAKTKAGWISLATGILGATGAGTVYYLGDRAMESYLAATTTAEAGEAWKSVTLYQGLFSAAAVLGGAGLGLSPLLLFGGPDPAALQRSIDALDEGIRALGQ